MSTIDADKLRSLYYDVAPHGPAAGDFLVSCGKKGIGTVYHVAESRKSPSRERYNLKVFKANELKSETRFVGPRSRWPRRQQYRAARALRHIEVRGIWAWPLFWYSRNKKKAA